MKPRCSSQRNRAFTIYEVLVVIIVILVLAILLLPKLAPSNHNGDIYCTMNLRQIDIAFLNWAGSHNDKFPMEVSVTNGGAMELVATGNVAACFSVMSNYLASPEVLICPNDTNHIAATNFGSGFDNSHISYFVGLDASISYPQRILSGDADLAIGGVPVKSGILEFSTNATVAWTKARHRYGGNLGYADGSVAGCRNFVLQSSLLATNRLAIP